MKTQMLNLGIAPFPAVLALFALSLPLTARVQNNRNPTPGTLIDRWPDNHFSFDVIRTDSSLLQTGAATWCG